MNDIHENCMWTSMMEWG